LRAGRRGPQEATKLRGERRAEARLESRGRKKKEQDPAMQDASNRHCVCGGAADARRDWLGCDCCQQWYHPECVGLTPAVRPRLRATRGARHDPPSAHGSVRAVRVIVIRL
jgi:hypothetical protein